MSGYVGRRILCRRCLDGNLPEGELLRYLDDYVAALPAEIRADPASYRARLEICARCPQQVQYTCALCGCYVQARAAKKALDCPAVPYSHWAAPDTDNPEKSE